MFDTGSFATAQMVHDAIRGWSESSPAHGGLHPRARGPRVRRAALRGRGGSRAGPPLVVAHENVPARFDRYLLTAGYNGAINRRQFRAAGAACRRPTSAIPTRPTATTLELEVGGERFELHHAKGETDDHTWTWIPGRARSSAPATSSSGPRRTPATRRRCSATRASGRTRCARWPRSTPRCCCPGHGLPVVGAERVQDGARATRAALLESLVEQTLALMNEGATLDDDPALGARARGAAGQALPATDLRRAGVHRAQPLAPVRRLVRRQPRAPEARARRAPGRGSWPPWPAAASGWRSVRWSWPRPASCGWPGTSPRWRRWPRPSSRRRSEPAPR